MEIVLATRNKGKIREFGKLIDSIPNAELVSLDAFPEVPEVEETGATIAENARLKAATYGRLCGVHAIADDSGLEVAVLQGRPGVYTARYAGADTKYEEKIRRLLAEVEDSNSENRSARFVAHIAFASPSGDVVFEAEGVCEGSIAHRPRGANGFGYDPIFLPRGYDLTFGELSDEVKSEISHRARATRKIMRFLRDFA
jgi:XTP/dITP diphosphohydrolase